MRSVVEIVTPAESELLTTLERVKAELQIATDANDEILEAKIAEASSDIQAALGKRLPREDVRRRSGMMMTGNRCMRRTWPIRRRRRCS